MRDVSEINILNNNIENIYFDELSENEKCINIHAQSKRLAKGFRIPQTRQT